MERYLIYHCEISCSDICASFPAAAPSSARTILNSCSRSCRETISNIVSVVNERNLLAGTSRRVFLAMASQAAYAKGRSRPTRQAAAQHRYADMKVDTNGYYYEEQVREIFSYYEELRTVMSPNARLTPHPSRSLLLQPYINGDLEPAGRVDLTKLKASPDLISHCSDTSSVRGLTALPFHCASLQVQALRKYTKIYEVAGVHPQSTREEMTSAVQRHWNAMVSKSSFFPGSCLRHNESARSLTSFSRISAECQ